MILHPDLGPKTFRQRLIWWREGVRFKFELALNRLFARGQKGPTDE